MAHHPRNVSMRKRVLKTLPRTMLDDMSGKEHPWNFDRASLEAAMVSRWDDEMKASIIEYFERHL